MEININFEELSPEDKLLFLDSISFEVFYALLSRFIGEDVYMHLNHSDPYNKAELELLQHNGFIKITSGDYDFALLEKSETFFGKKLDSLSELAEKLIEIYPQGVKSGGYTVRGSKVDVIDKLRKFFKKHKYTQEQVIQAIQKYVDRKREENWAYMQGLIFFIEKNGSSNLAAEIDGMKGDNNGAGEDWTRNIK
jgi:hypothetical protein